MSQSVKECVVVYNGTDTEGKPIEKLVKHDQAVKLLTGGRSSYWKLHKDYEITSKSDKDITVHSITKKK